MPLVKKLKGISEFKEIDIDNISNYEVNMKGEIRNKKSKRILKQQIDNYGYRIITIRDNFKKKKMIRAHRAVALTFLENPENKAEVNHIDCNKLNNNVTNLEWSTSSENKQHHLHRIGYHGGKLSMKCCITHKTTGKTLTFSTCSKAARYLNSSKANISRAIKKPTRTVKDYFIREV
jgi:hypothetical protein